MEHGFSMNKLELKRIILDLLEQKWQIAQSSVQSAIESATDEETVPEHKYDTLALEASYLAHGQAMRLQECEQEIRVMKELVLPIEPEKVAFGCVISLLDDDDQSKRFFISPCAGGLKVSIDDESVTLVTFDSPLGQALKSKKVGDEVAYKVAGVEHCYEIETIS